MVIKNKTVLKQNVPFEEFPVVRESRLNKVLRNIRIQFVFSGYSKLNDSFFVSFLNFYNGWVVFLQAEGNISLKKSKYTLMQS